VTGGEGVTEPGEDRVVPFSRRRAAIARRLTQSAQTIPHFYLSMDADVTPPWSGGARTSAVPGDGEDGTREDARQPGRLAGVEEAKG